jgi:tRNA pseudouridine65 synthase
VITEENIIYRDDDLVAINKPNGLLVHRTEVSEEDNLFALQLLRDLIGQRVYNAHRIDRPTSGVLLFALNNAMASMMNYQFKERMIKKTYVALVRGWFPLVAFLNHPVVNGKGVELDAETNFNLLEKYELSIPVAPYETSRYSMIEAHPVTGRWHQIRQHLAHLRHYIINDRVHGTSAYNHKFTDDLGISNLFLHARELRFIHPLTGKETVIQAGFPQHWNDFKELVAKYSVDMEHDS